MRFPGYRCLILFCVWLSAGPLAGQSLRLHLPPALKEPRAETVFEDRDGWLWIGGEQGLFRYDGKHIRPYQRTDTLQIAVTALFQDHTGVIWAGYKDGSIASVQGSLLVPFLPEEGLPKVPISGLLSDSTGALWIATYGEGLYVYANKHMYNINTDDGLADNSVYVMRSGPEGNIWAGSDGGISICNFRDGKKTVSNIGAAEGLPDNIVRDLWIDTAGDVWIGMYDQGVCRFSPSTRTFHCYQGEALGVVSSLLLTEHELWVGTEGNGLAILDKETLTIRQIYGKNEQFPHTRISAMIQDREGNIWLCGDRSGLQRVYPYLRTLPLPAGQTDGVRALLADRQNRIWVAGNGGLTCISGEQQQFIAVPGLSGQIISLYQDAQGWIWIGSFGEGVWRYHPEQKTFLHMTEAEGLSNGSVLSISGRGTEVWLATLGGVTRCRLGDNGGVYCEALEAPGGISLNYVYCIFPDSRGRIWFGTDGQGIFVRENSHITRFGETEGLKSEVIYSIAEDPQGRIWFNTSDAGIYSYDGTQFRQFTTAEGLRDNHSLSLISDKQGRLLSVHNSGLSLIETATGKITVFGPESGAGELDPDLNAVSADAGGRIWIGAQQKLLCYLPPTLSYRMTPLTVLDRIQIFLNDLTDTNIHEFGSDQNHLTFSFSGLWFRDPEAVTYQYQLEGYDLDWISTRESRAIYPRLSPGPYHFRVRTFVNGRPEDAPALQYDFRIRPPFWSTPWFVILTLMALAGAVYYFIRTREKRLRSQALLEQERIRFEFETLRNQVNPHFLFNSFNTLISIIEEDKDSAVEYVNRLSDLFRNMLAYREKSLISLKEELELLETYVYLQKKRYGDNLRLDFSVSDTDLNALIPPLTLQMLIENAVKHNVISRSQPLSIELRTAEGYLSVRNRIARKRSPVASTRLGLQNIRERYRILSGKDKEMKVEEGPEYFSVSIPLL